MTTARKLSGGLKGRIGRRTIGKYKMAARAQRARRANRLRPRLYR